MADRLVIFRFEFIHRIDQILIGGFRSGKGAYLFQEDIPRLALLSVHDELHPEGSLRSKVFVDLVESGVYAYLREIIRVEFDAE